MSACNTKHTLIEAKIGNVVITDIPIVDAKRLAYELIVAVNNIENKLLLAK